VNDDDDDDDEQTGAKIQALSGILTHSLSVQVIKAYASDRVATSIGVTTGNDDDDTKIIQLN
jgi:hypothetical protein